MKANFTLVNPVIEPRQRRQNRVAKTVGFNSLIQRHQNGIGTDLPPTRQIERVLVRNNGQFKRDSHAGCKLRAEAGRRKAVPTAARLLRAYLLNDFVKSSVVACTTFFSWRELAMSSFSLFSHALLSMGRSMLWLMSEE